MEKNESFLVIVADDDADICDILSYHVEKLDYRILLAGDGKEALKLIRKHKPSLCILDIMMPYYSGVQITEIIRKEDKNNIPVIIMSARNEEELVIKALESGADTFIPKPFSGAIVTATIKALMRRYTQKEQAEKPSDSIQTKNLIIDKKTHTLQLASKTIHLTVDEFNLLYILAKEEGRVFTRNQLISFSKGDDYPVTERTVDVQIASLRKKLKPYDDFIKTVWGIGYKFQDTE